MEIRFDYARLELSDGIARLTLDRPPLNILTIAMIAELDAALNEVEHAEGSRALVLTGAGKAFCAGVDVAEHTSEHVEAMLAGFSALYRRLGDMAIPTLAMVSGPALGGGTELALGCDLIIAGTSARFGQPEITLGVFPPIAAALLPSLIGYQQAANIILTGETLSAEEAARIGLITRAVPDEQLVAAVERVIERWRAMSSSSLRLTKRALLLGARRGLAGLEAIESLYLCELMATADAQEGIRAFMEKRRPIWREE